MIKMFGAVLILVACTGYAQKIIYTRKKSISNLFCIISGLKEMTGNISFMKRPLPEMICSLGQDSKNLFFANVLKIMSKDEKITVENAWQEALLNKNFVIEKRASELLSSLGKTLGKSSPKQEEENINIYTNQLCEILKTEEMAYTKSVKTIQSFGILSGIMIVILFI